ncbi:hypothetical protein VTK73DRAFT_9533 [Phialemonium thermophilum]|uniref:Cyclin-D1-binding protein 1-like N-terminal domain-containing protein n=1 Tax=Phialemonium thermophilum TaxID=223376 RepID=A0ABR3XK57_9PEZI
MTDTAPSGKSLEELKNIVASTINLVTQLEAALAKIDAEKEEYVSSASNNQDGTSQGISTAAAQETDVLALARDSATLIRAHATKISLLIINEPFTPSALTKVLRELVAGPLPALASAAQICDAARYTNDVRQDLTWRCIRVLREVRELVKRIPADGKVLSAAKRNGTVGNRAERGSLPVTGMLWSACDDVIALSKLGVAGYLVRKVEQFRDTLKDITEELKEWREEKQEEQGKSGDEDEDGDNNGTSSNREVETSNGAVREISDTLEAAHISHTQAMLDDLMNSQGRIPQDDPDKIRERLDSCLRRLRLITLLCQALIKRRLKTLPPLPTPVSPLSDVPLRLDETMAVLKTIPERFTSLAMAFYELDTESIDTLMDECFFDAFAASELLAKPWDGQKDEFTQWVAKFQIEIKRV